MWSWAGRSQKPGRPRWRPERVLCPTRRPFHDAVSRFGVHKETCLRRLPETALELPRRLQPAQRFSLEQPDSTDPSSSQQVGIPLRADCAARVSRDILRLWCFRLLVLLRSCLCSCSCVLACLVVCCASSDWLVGVVRSCGAAGHPAFTVLYVAPAVVCLCRVDPFRNAGCFGCSCSPAVESATTSSVCS